MNLLAASQNIRLRTRVRLTFFHVPVHFDTLPAPRLRGVPPHRAAFVNSQQNVPESL